jgi:hypothetical protein
MMQNRTEKRYPRSAVRPETLVRFFMRTLTGCLRAS